MYDDLVNRLHIYSEACVAYKLDADFASAVQEAADAIEELTGFVQEAERDRDEYRERLDKANDTIEELSKDLDSMNEANIALYGALPKWIPVSERLPEVGTYIIAGRMKYDYEKEYTHFVDVAYFGPRWNDADYSWQTFNDWFEGQQEFEITHWMPLPEPPKEE